MTSWDIMGEQLPALVFDLATGVISESHSSSLQVVALRTHKGRFVIASLSGSFLLSKSNGSHRRTGGLTVSLNMPDGKVFGGVIAGTLTDASPVQ
ncbi:AT-hook motif nuclear-localized protein 10, partial [Datura stramonium]|nr:AT-hook motif nuclear-localized protein 10 [Datura stramonium]